MLLLVSMFTCESNHAWSVAYLILISIPMPACARQSDSRATTGETSSVAAVSATSPKSNAASSAPPYDEPCSAVFHLCAPFLRDVRADTEPNAVDPSQYYVNIQLTESGALSFESFTRTWLRQRVCIAAGQQIVLAMEPVVVIPSGHIIVGRRDVTDAKALKEAIRHLPLAPCGP